eukprot:TRINITY_DN35076_c0_g1_i1.p1 TRINITY_DN35076_c0_g1~~TRINITY_DN35076_c0_g1_i1.p1  ORF type:complete len:357 (+),score=71.98 TRINITY_DN35076_c0_g1_i1:73-1143(+)
MPRPGRRSALACVPVIVALLVVLRLSIGSDDEASASTPQTAFTMLAAQQKVADGILLTAECLWHLAVFAVPRAAVLLLAYAAWQKRETFGPASWAGVVVAAFAMAFVWALSVKAADQAVVRQDAPSLTGGGEAAFQPMGGAGADAGAAGGLPRPSGPVRSGEEVCDADGACRRLADPSTPGGNIGENWQASLAGSMTEAIKNGKEQVVIVFSRRGCPYCDQQVPVLQRAIVKRASAGGMGAAGAAAPGLAFAGVGSGAGGTGLLFSPLRVFVLDADEFPYLTQQFQIEAFPTVMVFGLPGVTPLVAKGFLDDASFDQVIRAAALSPPPPGFDANAAAGSGGGGGGNVRGRRRGLFR